MISIKNKDNVVNLADGNQILGTFPELDNSEITFAGKNNILFCEEGVHLQGSALKFEADNSVIYLGGSKKVYKLNVFMGNDVAFYMGNDNYINKKMNVFLSEQRHCFIGDNCIFSWGICIRNADPHLIYSVEARKRLNPTKSVFIGDHVWIGQDCLLLKGTQIDSGSIIGAGSIVANKKIPHNESWAGNPVRRISDNVFWDGACVHFWTHDKSCISENYSEYVKNFKIESTADCWIYKYTENDVIKYSDIDEQLNKAQSSQERCDILTQIHEQRRKNRFVHKF